MTLTPTVTSGGTSGVSLPITVNSTTFTFSGLSTQALTSTMTISSISEGRMEFTSTVLMWKHLNQQVLPSKLWILEVGNVVEDTHWEAGRVHGCGAIKQNES